MRSSVVVAGSFNVDHVWRCAALPALGATIAGRYASGPGGKGFNQAVAARRAGADTTFICALGDDAGGALARQLADDDHIGLVSETSSQPTGTAGIYVDSHGHNSIVVGAGANASLSGAFVAGNAALIGRAGVLLTQLESPVDAIETALRIARDAGALTVFNPAPANAPSTASLLELADVLTPNETEFAALLARHAGERVKADAVAELDGASLHALCRKLSVNTVVITLGAAGIFVSHDAEHLRGDASAYYRIAAEPAHVADTTGAGDAFNGALAASLAQMPNAPFIQHARFANHYAARSTEQEGAALAMPWLKPND